MKCKTEIGTRGCKHLANQEYCEIFVLWFLFVKAFKVHQSIYAGWLRMEGDDNINQIYKIKKAFDFLFHPRNGGPMHWDLPVCRSWL